MSAERNYSIVLIKNSKIICNSCKKRGSIIVFGKVGHQLCSKCWLKQTTATLTTKSKIQHELDNILDTLSDKSSTAPFLSKIFEVKIYSGTYPTCFFCALSKETMVTIRKDITMTLAGSNFIEHPSYDWNWGSGSSGGGGGGGAGGAVWVGSWAPVTITTNTATAYASNQYALPMTIKSNTANPSGGGGYFIPASTANWHVTTPTTFKDIDSNALVPKTFCVPCARKFTRILSKQITNFLKFEKKEFKEFHKMIAKIKEDTGAVAELLEEQA